MSRALSLMVAAGLKGTHLGSNTLEQLVQAGFQSPSDLVDVH